MGIEIQDTLWTLLNLAIRSAALAAVALAGIWILRVKSAAARHAVWSLVTLGMLALAVLSPVLPPLPIPVLRPLPDTPLPALDTPPAAAVAQEPPAAPLPPARPVRSAPGWPEAVAGFYALGAILLLGRLTFGFLFTVRLVRAATPVDRPGSGDLFESSWISVPLTVGWLRPKILLPAGWQSWQASKLDAVLAHERTHIRRRDWAVSLLAGLNRSIFWFHPLSWWLEHTLASLAEQACDDEALLQVKSGHYAQALLDMAAAVRSGQGRLVWEAMAMAKAAEVKQRIERILDDSRRIPQALTRARWAALIAFAAPLVYLVSVVQPVPAQPRTPAQAADFLKDRHQLSAPDVTILEQYLNTNPHDLDVRNQLVLHYFANGMRAERMAHVVWLVTNHPESNAAVIGSLGFSPRPNSLHDPADYDRIAGLWKQQAAAHARDLKVVFNAAQFFSQLGSDYTIAESLLKSYQPTNRDITDRLGKVYARAILGAQGDPVFPNSAPAMAQRVRSELENPADGWLVWSTGNAILSAVQRPTPGKPLPDGVLNLDDHGRLLPAVDFAERLRTRSRDLGVPTSINGAASFSPATPAPAAPLPDAPTPLRRVEPVYPALVQQARISGTIKLAVTLDASGNVQNLSVISGHPLMAPAALEAVRQWTFPSGKAGQYLLTVEGDWKTSNFSPNAVQPAPQTAIAPPLPPAPTPTHTVDPEYPPLARQARISGTVRLRMKIAADGSVQELQVFSGHPLLAPAALDAVRRWTFPAGSGGMYVLDVPFNAPPLIAGETLPADASRKNSTSTPQRIRVGANVQAASLAHKVDPIYPQAARDAGIEGAVTVTILINKDGTVATVDPVDGHPLLLAAAAQAIRQWTYRPTLLNQEPVEVSTTVTVPFVINR